MSLARALTKRMRREEPAAMTSPNGQVRYAPGTIRRNMISSPTELLSTTNVQALTAPDIDVHTRSLSSKSSSSVESNIDSDFSMDRGFLSPADDSSVDSSSPVTPVTPAREHGKDFFSAKASAPLSREPTPATPAVPTRSASHSKKAHVEMARSKSIQRRSPPPDTIDKPIIRNSAEIFHLPSQEHPFGRELAKVNEVAEDFGATMAVLEEEEVELLSKGLRKFSVDEYINEIIGLYHGGVLEDNLANPWL